MQRLRVEHHHLHLQIMPQSPAISKNIFYQSIYCKRNDKLGHFRTTLRNLASP